MSFPVCRCAGYFVVGSGMLRPILLQLRNVASSTGILERVTGQARAFVEHGQSGVSASLEQRQRLVAAGRLVAVTAGARVASMAHGAGGTVDGGVLAM